MRAWRNGLWWSFASLVVAFMLSPIVILMVFAFNRGELLSFPMTGFSFRWFADVFTRPEFVAAFENSLIVSTTVGMTATVVGTMAAMGLARLRVSISAGIMTALTVPLMVPPLMLGVMLLSYYTQWLGLRLGLSTVIISHLVFTQPFVILIVSSRMAAFDFAVVDSARDLGASSLRTFFTITLPIIASSILGAALIAMAMSMDDFLVTFFTIGGGNTLPTYMWGMLRRGVDPSINVVAVLLMLFSISASLIGFRITRYGK